MDKVRDRVEDTEHRIAQSIDEATDSETIVNSMCLGIEEYRKTGLTGKVGAEHENRMRERDQEQ